MTDTPSVPPTGRRVAFAVYGCRLNQAEAETWKAALAQAGACLVPATEEADILCVHSCAVTAPAAREAIRAIRAFRAKDQGRRVLVSGCAAALLPPGLADCVIPHAEKARWLERALPFLRGLGALAPLPAPPPPRRTRASLIAQDGCDAFCAYCIVPHMRGAPVSEPLPALLARAKALIGQGYAEIVLTGCNLALYRDPISGVGLDGLLARLCELPGEGRFRLGSLEPCVIDDAAIARRIAASGGRLCPFLHLPIQTVSDTLLARMGRPYSAARLRAALDAICATLPALGLGADWIAGLPGESEADHAATLRLLADYPFTGAHVFPYSRRPGTPAADFPDQLPPARIAARATALRQAAAQTRARALRTFIGRPLTVIPETCREGHWVGHSAEYLRCRLSAPATRGRPTPFTPTAVRGDCLV